MHRATKNDMPISNSMSENKLFDSDKNIPRLTIWQRSCALKYKYSPLWRHSYQALSTHLMAISTNWKPHIKRTHSTMFWLHKKNFQAREADENFPTRQIYTVKTVTSGDLMTSDVIRQIILMCTVQASTLHGAASDLRMTRFTHVPKHSLVKIGILHYYMKNLIPSSPISSAFLLFSNIRRAFMKTSSSIPWNSCPVVSSPFCSSNIVNTVFTIALSNI